MLYAGNIPQYNADGSPMIGSDGKQVFVHSSEYAKTTAATSGGTIAVIDNTEASRFVGDNSFKEAILKSLDNNPEASNQFFNGTTDANGVRTSHGLNGDLSVKFVSENNFEQAITFSHKAGNDSILFSKEVPTLLEKEGFKKIDGLQTDYLKSLKDATGKYDDIISDIKSSSGAHFGLLETAKDVEGKLAVGTIKFLENVEGVQSVSLPAGATDIKSGATILGKDLSWVGSHILPKAVLNKLGVAGDLLSASIAVRDANAAEEAGDHAGAVDIMAKWSAEFLGGIGGSTAAVVLITPLVPFLAPQAVVAGAITIAAGVVGGYYGGEFGAYLYEKAKELGVYGDNALKQFNDALTDYWNDLNADANTVSDAVAGAYQSFATAVLNAIRPKDPLIIDKNNDGLTLSSWQSSGVRFDMDGNGTSESTGWTMPANSDYQYVKGSGAIIINQANANLIDRIVFGAGISRDNIEFSEVGVWDSSVPGAIFHRDLVITFKDSPNDKITILNYFRSPTYVWNNGIGTPVDVDPYKINGLKFADGSEFNFSDLKYKIEGTAGNDSLSGLGYNNSNITIINSGAGDDSIYGDNLIVNSSTGNDYFQLSNGNNKISSGAGKDWVRLGNGNNEVYSGDGDDQIEFGSGNNFISSGRGNDSINAYSANGNNIINSGSGADSIFVGDGNNSINAGSGDDTINSGLGSNVLTGEAGADYFNIRIGNSAEQQVDVITDFDPNAGDRISFSFDTYENKIKFSDLNIYQYGADAVIEFPSKKIVLKNFQSANLKAEFLGLKEKIIINGGIFDDEIYPDIIYAEDITVNAGDGNDYIVNISGATSGSFNGGDGNDKIYSYVIGNFNLDGGLGNDELKVGYDNSNSIIRGGAGSDKFIFDTYSTTNNTIVDFDPTDINEKIIINNSIDSFDDFDIVDSEQGAVITYRSKDYNGEIFTNTITLNGVLKSQLSADNFTTDNIIQTTTGNDIINVADTTISYVINDNGGNDNYQLGSGNDSIFSINGNKVINSGAGDDYIYANYGSSIINGEAGNDTIYYYSGNLNGAAFTISGGDGNDKIDSYSYNEGSSYIYAGVGDDSINIRWGNSIEINGDDGNDVIKTSSKKSQIYGGNGNDLIELNDSATENNIIAGSGDDIILIRPNAANNIISGGSGGDNFVIREIIYADGSIVASNNIITDFEINNSNEKINFQFKNITNLSELKISQNGADAVITYGLEQSTLTLKNVNASHLSAQNFIFKNVGSQNNDIIDANNVYNIVDGGNGNDIISANGVENVLYGGAGNDIFVIAKNPSSKTTIKDFSLFSSAEKIKLEGFSELSFSDLFINYSDIYNKGEYRVYNVTINLGDGQSLVIEGVKEGSLTADRFLFNDLTSEELTEFNNSVEQLDNSVVSQNKTDDESNDKIFSDSKNSIYIKTENSIRFSVDGTYINVTPKVNDDIFLVLDKNDNGNIDDVTELFGNNSRSGFEELSKYDSNADNVINSADSQYNLLKFWNDTNANGKVENGELKTLSESKVEEISLRTINSSKMISGNLVNRTSEIKFSDGNVGTVNEVFFATNNFNSSVSNPDQVLGINFVINTAALTLPYSRGYGNLYSWQVAMSLNEDLLNTAQMIAGLNPSQFGQIDSLFEKFLYEWAGVDSISANNYLVSADGNKMEQRKIAFLEKITDLHFSFPTGIAIMQAQTSWTMLYNSLLSRFLVQSVFKDVFPDATYDIATDSLKLGITLDQAITNILAQSTQIDQSSFINYAYYSKTILQLNKDQFSDVNFDAKVDSMISNVVNSISIAGFNLNGVFNIGNTTDETLFGSNNSDIIKGEGGRDTIISGSGNDYIEGGAGDDYLRGEDGNDIYKYNLGDGRDVVEENSGTDKIIFGEGITQSSLAFAKVGNDLVINIGSNGDQIGIKNFYLSSTKKIEII